MAERAATRALEGLSLLRDPGCEALEKSRRLRSFIARCCVGACEAAAQIN